MARSMPSGERHDSRQGNKHHESRLPPVRFHRVLRTQVQVHAERANIVSIASAALPLRPPTISASAAVVMRLAPGRLRHSHPVFSAGLEALWLRPCAHGRRLPPVDRLWEAMRTAPDTPGGPMTHNIRRATIGVLLAVISTTGGVLASSAAGGSGSVVLGSAEFAKPDGEGWGSAQPARIYNGGDPSGLVKSTGRAGAAAPQSGTASTRSSSPAVATTAAR